MADTTLPSTMRVWKHALAEGGLEKNLTLHTSDPLPKPGPNQRLIKVLAVGLNPVDFKRAEAPYIGRFAVKKPATPGFDVADRIVTPADGSSLEPG
jgi:NADPH:quinone reductase-like Zn-dependent oxidoreductase